MLLLSKPVGASVERDAEEARIRPLRIRLKTAKGIKNRMAHSPFFKDGLAKRLYSGFISARWAGLSSAEIWAVPYPTSEDEGSFMNTTFAGSCPRSKTEKMWYCLRFDLSGGGCGIYKVRKWGRLCKNKQRLLARDRLRCRAKFDGCWGFEAEINCYSRAMATAYASVRLEARARFQSIAALVTPKFGPVERALQSGCAG